MLKKILIFVILNLVILMPISTVFAQEAFNPHYIISNNELTDYTAMNMDDVYNFLKAKGSILHNYIDPNVRMITPQVILDSAWLYQISPKYILTLLQKEQSLVTDSSPSQGQLDWATGYGCPDSGGCNAKYKGTANQIDWGAGAIRYYLDHPGEFKYQTGQSYDIDGEYVTITNDATRALYIYTPHIHGNEVFYNIWSSWFATENGDYPDGSLLQSAVDGGIWLIQNGQKRAFQNKSTFVSRYSFDKVLSVDPTKLNKYPTGEPIKYSNYSLLKVPTGEIYLLDNDNLRQIVSMEVFRVLGLNPEEIISVESTEISSYALGESITIESSYPTGGLLQDKTTGGVYYVENGQKHPIWSKQLMNLYYPKFKLTQASSDELEKYPTQDPVKFKDGELVKSDKDPVVYVISNGERRAIADEKTFISLWYKWNNIITTTNQILGLHPLGDELSIN
ncbi:MAG: hypothetical protein ABIF17_02240 [Patescibacteria group bacterium]